MKTKKIVDYKIIIPCVDSLDEFNARVREEIKIGWEPMGGVCAAKLRGDGEVTLFQAMVRYENECIKSSDEISEKYYENLRKLEVENMKAFNERCDRAGK